MQNDVLKNEIAPWQEKGRWYHISATCNGSTWVINKDKTDERFKNISITSGYYLILANDYTKPITILDTKVKLTFTNVTASLNIGSAVFYLSYGIARPSYCLCAPTSYYGYVDLYLFIAD